MEGPPRRAVFDTGVILQATISAAGPAGRAMYLFDQDEIVLFVSPELLLEVRRVLVMPTIRLKNNRYSDSDIEALLSRLATSGTFISEIPTHYQCERDPEDDHVINLAIEANADYLVTRDKDMLELMTDSEFVSRFPNVTILDPGAFLKRIEKT